MTNLVYLDLSFNKINDMNVNDFGFNNLNFLEYINLNRSLAVYLINTELKFGNNSQHAILSTNGS